MEPPAEVAVAAGDATHIPPAPSPFATLRVRDLLAFFLLFLFLVIVLLTAIANWTGAKKDMRLMAVLFTLAMLLPVLIRAKRTKLSWRRVFGSALERRDLPLTIAVLPVALLTIASSFLVYVPLSYLFPDYVRRALLDGSVYDARTLGQWLLLAFGAAVAAPVIEEVVFRGIILQRWAYRWGTRTGAIASSALFAVGHGEWFGHFLFGMVMALLYLRTRKLWVPIAAHGLNNFVLMLPILWTIVAHHPPEPPETLDAFRAQRWMGGPALLMGLLLGWLYLRVLWPRGSVREALAGEVPYERAT